MKHFLLVFVIILSSQAKAEGLGCSLKKEDYQDYQPHTKVEADINGDGLKDFFYLAGEETEYQTCIYLAQKAKPDTSLVLKHEHSGFYDVALNFKGKSIPQFLVPEMPIEDCEESGGNHLIPKKMEGEIKAAYSKWSKGFAKFNFTYGVPDFFPIMNLFLLNDVRIFEFHGDQKVDVSGDSLPYFALKRTVLSEVLKNADLTSGCKARLQKTLKSSLQAAK